MVGVGNGGGTVSNSKLLHTQASQVRIEGGKYSSSTERRIRTYYIKKRKNGGDAYALQKESYLWSSGDSNTQRYDFTQDQLSQERPHIFDQAVADR